MSQPVLSQTLNRYCHCITLDKARLKAALDQQRGEPGFADQLEVSHPHLFCPSATFIDARHVADMQSLIAATRRLAETPGYQQWALQHADPAARQSVAHDSVFFGYDFHVSAEGVQLIEINTNAGGGLLNAMLSRAQLACCDDVTTLFTPAAIGSVERGSASASDNATSYEERFLKMFLQEWQLARGSRPLRSIAIVDDAPEQQGLYPEFLLFKSLFEAHGIEAWILSPEQLHISQGELRAGDRVIDMVYSRLTDFHFAELAHSVLREAWLNNNAVITPHPRAYALYANKRNMTVMSDPTALAAWGVSEQDQAIFANAVPITREVSGLDPEQLWAERKAYFFKPAQGFGSKAAYRGDKITRKVFDNLLKQGDYLAQSFSAPGQRHVQIDGNDNELKFDVRAYVYQGEIQLLAARVYQGQTTNMRTLGGGFSGVFLVPAI